MGKPRQWHVFLPFALKGTKTGPWFCASFFFKFTAVLTGRDVCLSPSQVSSFCCLIALIAFLRSVLGCSERRLRMKRIVVMTTMMIIVTNKSFDCIPKGFRRVHKCIAFSACTCSQKDESVCAEGGCTAQGVLAR